MRIKKRPEEIDLMKTTCRVSAEAHCEVMRAVRPGISERALHGIFLKAIMERGAAREGYGAILASGSNATTLHYVFNDQICREGDLILVDAGAECDYYTGDITRTYPVNGKFSEAQKRIYHKVLRLQKELIQCVRPGQTLANLQKHTISVLVDIMIEEKLLKGNPVDLISNLAFRKYYPHGVGHWLGSDVHDAGLADLKGEARTLEPGFCLTIEPGIYIPAGDQGAPESLRGIGIRIEDNILVTADGCDVLTSAAPKEIDELEALIGSGLS